MVTRRSGSGGVALTSELPWISGVASYEVAIREMDRGSEGLEMGFTEITSQRHMGYAVLCKPSWVSSDAGYLWVNGAKQYHLPPWKVGTMITLRVIFKSFK